jgi:putative hydrolase of the HAD superfamily
MIRAERGLRQLLRRLPGRKILLTNAPHRYSSQVLRHLGLQRQFSTTWRWKR